MEQRWLELQGITASDLESNRKGRLAPVQAERVRAEIATRKRRFTIAVVIGAVFAITVAALTGKSQALYIVIPAALILDGILLFGVLGTFVRRMEREITEGAVTAREVTIETLSVVPSRQRIVIWIGRYPYTGLKMAELGGALKEGDRVKLHVLPKSRAIVAVEPGA